METRIVAAALIALTCIVSASPDAAMAQPSPATPFDMSGSQSVQSDQAAEYSFSSSELRKLLAPYALYPDELLAQMLPACAYPVEIVQVSRWLEKNRDVAAKGDFAALDAQPWDASVKALARFPGVIAKLNADLDATSDIGDAFVNQPKDVADMIQTLRQEAQKGGALASTPQQVVSTQTQGDTSYIAIEPAEPGVIYVPSYDPEVVYDTGTSTVGSGLIGFGVGVAVGAVIDNVWDWGLGWVYPPRWPGYPGYRPGGGNINIGNDINIGNGNTRPWRPDADRYHPGQGSKPGLARPGARPGGGAGLAGDRSPGNRPDVGQRPGAGGGLPARPDGGRPDIAQRPGGGAGPGVGGGRADAIRPDAGQRPAASRPQPPRNAAAKPAQRPKPNAASRPAPKAPPRPSAFSDVRAGGNAHGYAQRGSASRQSISRPPVQRGRGGGRGGGGGRGR